MVEIKNIIFTKKFKNEIRERKDHSTKNKIKKKIKKIIDDPEIGKPLRYDLKGEKTVYIEPFRLVYSIMNNDLYFLRFEHRKKVY